MTYDAHSTSNTVPFLFTNDFKNCSSFSETFPDLNSNIYFLFCNLLRYVSFYAYLRYVYHQYLSICISIYLDWFHFYPFKFHNLHLCWVLLETKYFISICISTVPQFSLVAQLGPTLQPTGEGNGIPLQYSCLENPMDGEPGRLQSMGSLRVGHDWSDLAAATYWTAAYQTSLSITNSWSLLKLTALSRCSNPTVSSSVVHLSSCLQSFPASGSFQISQLFASGGHSIGVSDSASVLPMNVQDWYLLGWTGWISLQSKGLSRVFSYITVQRHQFISTQLFL